MPPTYTILMPCCANLLGSMLHPTTQQCRANFDQSMVCLSTFNDVYSLTVCIFVYCTAVESNLKVNLRSSDKSIVTYHIPILGPYVNKTAISCFPVLLFVCILCG